MLCVCVCMTWKCEESISIRMMNKSLIPLLFMWNKMTWHPVAMLVVSAFLMKLNVCVLWWVVVLVTENQKFFSFSCVKNNQITLTLTSNCLFHGETLVKKGQTIICWLCIFLYLRGEWKCDKRVNLFQIFALFTQNIIFQSSHGMLHQSFPFNSSLDIQKKWKMY